MPDPDVPARPSRLRTASAFRRRREPSPDEVRPMLSVHCTRSGDRVEVTSIGCSYGSWNYGYPEPERGFAISLRDAAGRALARRHLREGFVHFVGGMRRSDDGEPLGLESWAERSHSYHADIPALPAGVELAIVDGDRVLWSRRAPARRPTIGPVRATIEGDALRVRWTDDVAGEHYAAEVLCACESTPGLMRVEVVGRGEAEGPLTDYPSGPLEVYVRVHDGFYFEEARPVVVRVPTRPLSVEIVRMWPDAVVPAGAPMMISGHASLGRATSVPHDAVFRWSVDGTEIATGEKVWIDAPPEGEHVLRLDVACDGREGSASVSLRCGPPGNDAGWRMFADVFRDGKPLP